MRVSVVVNAKAGSVNGNLLIEKINEALFRCQIEYCFSSDQKQTAAFIASEISQKTDGFLICGGDGTLNVALQILMEFPKEELPPIAIVRSGTANDFAQALGISQKINDAARCILEGTIQFIDIIEISASNQKAYMLTNGGLGIAALTAQYANSFREKLRDAAYSSEGPGVLRWLGQKGEDFVKKSGSGIYPLMLIGAMREWDQSGWALEFEIEGGLKFETQSPIVLVNNQPSIGANFFPAPYTNNTDGTVNLLVSNTTDKASHLKAIWDIKTGKTNSSKRFSSYELSNFRVRIQNPERKINFFGDGEILLKDASEISVRCLHKCLPIFLRE